MKTNKNGSLTHKILFLLFSILFWIGKNIGSKFYLNKSEEELEFLQSAPKKIKIKSVESKNRREKFRYVTFQSTNRKPMRLQALWNEELQESSSLSFLNIQKQKVLQKKRKRLFYEKSLTAKENRAINLDLQDSLDTFQTRNPLNTSNLSKNQIFDLWSETLPFHFIRIIKDNVHIRTTDQKKILFCLPPKTGSTSWHVVGDSIVNSRTVEYEKTLFNSEIEHDRIMMPRISQVIPKCRNLVLTGNDSNSVNNCNPFDDIEKPYKKKHFVQIFKDDKKFSRNFDFVATDPLNLKYQKAKRIIKYLEDLLDSKETLRIIHTRHPFIRLYSAWTDKFFLYRDLTKQGKQKYSRKTKEYHDSGTAKVYGKFWKLAQKYDRKNKKPLPAGAQASFSAFIKFLLNDKGFTTNFDKHWMPISLLCGVDQIKYNFFTKLETIDSDFEYFKYKNDLGYLPEFPKSRFSSFTDKDNEGRYFDKYVTIYKESTSLKDRLKLYEIFKQDFEMFGYDYEPFLI